MLSFFYLFLETDRTQDNIFDYHNSFHLLYLDFRVIEEDEFEELNGISNDFVIIEQPA
jgi:hypothetical protein